MFILEFATLFSYILGTLEFLEYRAIFRNPERIILAVLFQPIINGGFRHMHGSLENQLDDTLASIEKSRDIVGTERTIECAECCCLTGAGNTL